MISRPALALALVLAQGAPTGWDLASLTPGIGGTRGARQPFLSADGSTVAFQADADLGVAPGNGDANPEIFAWRAAGLAQVTDTSRAAGGSPSQSRPSVSGDGRRVAFLSNADLAGANADRSVEVFVRDEGGGFRQVSDGPAGSAAEGPALSRDGAWVSFWHDADLAGANPDGGLELFRAAVGGPVVQLTSLSGRPSHSLTSISADGAAIAFILEADLVGANADASWELFRWAGPPSAPGDPARFAQLTDWRPPMTGRTIVDPSISGDGSRVAFAGNGHVDASQPAGHIATEIYLWVAGTGVTRLTTASGTRLSSVGPRIADDGRHVAFVSTSSLATAGPGNADENADLFVWSACGPAAATFFQVTASSALPNVVATDPEVVPAIDGPGVVAAFASEREADPGPLVRTSRKAFLFRAVQNPPSPCAPVATPTPAATAPPSPVPTASATPPAPPATPGAGGVCPQVTNRIPPAVVADALARPEAFYGWRMPANPSLPPGRYNPPRIWLSLLDPGKPFGPANGVVWKAGCP